MIALPFGDRSSLWRRCSWSRCLQFSFSTVHLRVLESLISYSFFASTPKALKALAVGKKHWRFRQFFYKLGQSLYRLGQSPLGSTVNGLIHQIVQQVIQDPKMMRQTKFSINLHVFSFDISFLVFSNMYKHSLLMTPYGARVCSACQYQVSLT